VNLVSSSCPLPLARSVSTPGPTAESIPARAPSSEDLAAALLAPGTSAAERAEFLAVARAYRPEVLEALLEDGYRVSYTDRLPPHVGGLHDPFRKTVEIAREWEPAPRRRAILHELAHAVDALRFRQKTSWLARHTTAAGRYYATQLDPAIAGLYRDYLARSAVDEALRTRQELLASRPDSPGPVSITTTGGVVRLGPGSSGRSLLEVERRVPRQWTRRVVLPALGAAVSLAAAVAVPGLALVAGPAAVWSLYRLYVGACEVKEAGRFSRVESQVVRKNGESLQVLLQDGRHAVELPSAPGEEAMFSRWATRSQQVIEYFAEGMASYLESPQERERLRRMDPGFYDYLAGWHVAADSSGPCPL
jgi:hypothetical protein